MANEEKAISTVEAIKQWAVDRNLHTVDPNKQIFKLMEETGELAAGIARGNKDLIEDAVGDMVVVQTILLMQVNEDINDVFSHINALEFGSVAHKNDDELMRELFIEIHELSIITESFNLGTAPSFESLGNVVNIILSLENIALNHNLDFNKCIDAAYNEIKDRKGVMIDGVFIKAADL